jgi:hypothetical protein
LAVRRPNGRNVPATNLCRQAALRLQRWYSLMITVDNLSWSQLAGGGRQLHLFLRDGQHSSFPFLTGDVDEYDPDSTGDHPEGWLFWGRGWSNSRGKPSTNAKYSITTDWKPGFVPIFFQGKAAMLDLMPARHLTSLDNIAIVQALARPKLSCI